MGYTQYLIAALVAGIGILIITFPHLQHLNSVLNLTTDFTAADAHLATFVAKHQCTRKHPSILVGCEDMMMHKNTIYTACLASPALGNMHKWGRGVYTNLTGIPGDRVYKWNLDTDQVDEVTLANFPGGEDDGAAYRSFLGMDFNERKDGKLSVYMINLLPTGNVVEKFEHDPKTTVFRHTARVETNKPQEDSNHPANKDPNVPWHPNSVFALPEKDDEMAMYVTHDHYYDAPFTRFYEYAAMRPLTFVSYYSTKTGWKKVVDKLVGANGVTGHKLHHNRQIFVAAAMSGVIHVYRPSTSPNAISGELEHIQDITVKVTTDNCKLIGDDLWIPGMARGFMMDAYMDRPEGALTPFYEGGPGMAVKRVSVKQLGEGFYGRGFTAQPTVETVVVDGMGKVANGTSTVLFRKYEEENAKKQEPEKSIVEDEDEDEDVGELDAGVPRGELYITGLKNMGILKCIDVEA